ncbi:hypothetical protein PtA15_1A980 [Puccinia triticina]|uniref:Uncharacterized protein n=1 Tax=Puccinia triticina TaxID=208348 RepID=A0ABY7C8Z4_9BASI|nr:uncharacterized protein PtA15_1A980 [Puccinia triticina]WAQ81638.1 hypothetical protein PtA15_1A980 [Puccinia triticina]
MGHVVGSCFSKGRLQISVAKLHSLTLTQVLVQSLVPQLYMSFNGQALSLRGSGRQSIRGTGSSRTLWRYDSMQNIKVGLSPLFLYLPTNSTINLLRAGTNRAVRAVWLRWGNRGFMLGSEDLASPATTPTHSPAKRTFAKISPTAGPSKSKGKEKATDGEESEDETEDDGEVDIEPEEEEEDNSAPKPARGRRRKAILKDAAKRLKKL